MSQVNRGDEDDFTARLAAFDAALAEGTLSWTDTTDDPELRGAMQCLEQLAAIWPRRNRGQNVPNSSAETLWATGPIHIGRFRIVRELGRGGGGIVYLADDPKLRRQVAIKVPRSEFLFTPEMRRFARQGVAGAQLDHANIVPILEVGEAGGICYIVSAYCAGPNLAQWLSGGTVPPRQAAEIVAALADGVAHMHEKGILHRDIKPANVLMEARVSRRDAETTEQDQGLSPHRSSSSSAASASLREMSLNPRLTDFGLAKFQEGASAHTATGAILGTPAYMAPEQAQGRLDLVGPATDVYALGVVLYELLAGKPPFRGATDVVTLQQVVNDEPRGLRRQRGDVSRDLEAVCLKCLAKRPAGRYPTAEALAEDIRNYLAGRPTVARPPTMHQQAIQWARRRPMAAALVATVSLAAISLLGGVGRYAVQQERHNTELTRINEDLAETAQREFTQRRLAEDSVRRLRLNAYADGLGRVLESQQHGRILQAVEWLNELRPGPGEQDLRGFEWHYLQGRCHPLRAVLRGHLEAVTCVAASPDGRTLASGSYDRTVRLWDIESGQAGSVLSGHELGVRSVAFSPDGRTLASVSDNAKTGELIIWDVATAKLRARSELPRALHARVAFAPDGKTFAVSTHNGFGFWDAATGKQRAFHPVAPFHIISIAFAPDGRSIATGNTDFTIRLWDVQTGGENGQLKATHECVWSVAYFPDGRTLASDGTDQVVWLWDLASLQQRAGPKHLLTRVISVAFSNDGRTLASTAHDDKRNSEVRLWDVATGSLIVSYDRYLSAGSVAFVPGRHLLAGCWDKTVRLLDTAPAPMTKQLPGHAPKQSWALAFSPDGKTLASSGDDHQVRLWDMATGQQRTPLEGHEALVAAVSFSADGKMLASASYDSTARLWDPATGTLQATLSAEGPPLRCLALSPDGTILAAGTRSKGPSVVRLWDTRTNRELPSLSGHLNNVRCVAFSPDGTILASGSEDGRLRWWKTSTWQLSGQLDDSDQVTCLAFAPDGQTVAAGNEVGAVHLWDLAASQVKATLNGHTGPVFAVAFNPDGRTLCSAGDDKTVRLWQSATGRGLAVLDGHNTRVNAVAFTPDGRTLASCDHDGIIKLWCTPTPPTSR